MEASYLYAACHCGLSHTQQDKNKDICGAKSYSLNPESWGWSPTVHRGGAPPTPSAEILLAKFVNLGSFPSTNSDDQQVNIISSRTQRATFRRKHSGQF